MDRQRLWWTRATVHLGIVADCVCRGALIAQMYNTSKKEFKFRPGLQHLNTEYNYWSRKYIQLITSKI